MQVDTNLLFIKLLQTSVYQTVNSRQTTLHYWIRQYNIRTTYTAWCKQTWQLTHKTQFAHITLKRVIAMQLHSSHSISPYLSRLQNFTYLPRLNHAYRDFFHLTLKQTFWNFYFYLSLLLTIWVTVFITDYFIFSQYTIHKHKTSTPLIF